VQVNGYILWLVQVNGYILSLVQGNGYILWLVQVNGFGLFNQILFHSVIKKDCLLIWVLCEKLGCHVWRSSGIE